MTNTNEKTHEIIKKSLKKSPIFNKNLGGVSPRYCPSIEDKIYKFYNKKSHNIFIEPEGINTSEYYPNGISTSLPYKIQKKFLNSIKGLENTKITRPGYGVEYDFFNPKELKPSLESKIINNLFFAGQINGTTGYEEAAAQGLIAGLNIISLLKEKKNIIINKKKSYIGLMIYDLIKYGVNEPYRVFTSKSTNQISIREDNTDERLLKYIKINKVKNKNLKNKIIMKNFILKKINFIKIINTLNLNNIINSFKIINENYLNNIHITIYIYNKYCNYLKIKNKIKIQKKNKIKNINYFDIKNLSKEFSEKLNKIKPRNINELKKVPNINKYIIKSIIKNN